MKRPVLIHSVLLSVALLAAYFTWTREQPGAAEDEVQILNLRGSLDRVIYASEDRTVEIDRRKDDTGAYYWLRVETMETPPPPLPPPLPEPKPEVKAEPKAGVQPEPKAGVKVEPKAGPKVEPKKVEPKKVEPRKGADKVQPKASESSLARDPKADPEPKKAQPKKAEPKKAEPKKAEPKKAEPKKPEPKKAEPKKAEPKKAEPEKPTPGPGQVDPKTQPRPVHPGHEPVKAEPGAGGPAPAPAPAPAPPPKPLPKVRKVQHFKGSKSVEELMKGLANLSAVRSLGKVDADKLKAFGLEGSKKTLTLVSGSSPRVFIIGGNTFGNMDTYLMNKEDGRVFVVRPRLLQDFMYAEYRLMDRSLHSVENNELEQAVITVEDKKRTLVQQNRRDPAGAYWADEAAPEQRKDFIRNWMAKLLGLRVLEYVAPDKKLEGLKPILSVEYLAGGKVVGQLQLFKQQTLIPGVAASTPDGAGDYYARTENSRSYVKLGRPSGDEIARDVAQLMRE